MSTFNFSDVYEDEDGWWHFNVTLETGEVVESGEYFHKQNAVNDLGFIKSSHSATIEFLKDFSRSYSGRCGICGREFDDTVNEHHLFPQVKGGKKKKTVMLHDMCHSKIHSVFTEWELNHYYHTIDRIMENEDMQTFAKWMAKKPLGFKDSNRMTNRRNPNRR